jgi:hypothetical protein
VVCEGVEEGRKKGRKVNVYEALRLRVKVSGLAARGRIGLTVLPTLFCLLYSPLLSVLLSLSFFIHYLSLSLSLSLPPSLPLFQTPLFSPELSSTFLTSPLSPYLAAAAA